MRQVCVSVLVWIVGGTFIFSPIIPDHLPYVTATFAQHQTIAGNCLWGEAPLSGEESEEKRKRLNRQRFQLVREDCLPVSIRGRTGRPLYEEALFIPPFLRHHTLKRFVPSDEADPAFI